MDEKRITNRENQSIPLTPDGIDQVIVNDLMMIDKGREVSEKSPGRFIGL